MVIQTFSSFMWIEYAPKSLMQIKEILQTFLKLLLPYITLTMPLVLPQ